MEDKMTTLSYIYMAESQFKSVRWYQRKGSVSYGLGTDFSLPHCLVGDKVSESSVEPSPAGISEPRAEISWCIVMVQRFGKVSRGTAVGCIFLSFSAILILRLAIRPKTS